MHGKRGVICPLFGFVSVCVLYLFYVSYRFLVCRRRLSIYIYSILIDLHRTMYAVLNNMCQIIILNPFCEPIAGLVAKKRGLGRLLVSGFLTNSYPKGVGGQS